MCCPECGCVEGDGREAGWMRDLSRGPFTSQPTNEFFLNIMYSALFGLLKFYPRFYR